MRALLFAFPVSYRGPLAAEGGGVVAGWGRRGADSRKCEEVSRNGAVFGVLRGFGAENGREDRIWTRPDFTGRRPDLSWTRPDFTGRRPDLSWRRPDFTGRRPDLSWRREDFTGTRPDLSWRREDFTGTREDCICMGAGGAGNRTPVTAPGTAGTRKVHPFNRRAA